MQRIQIYGLEEFEVGNPEATSSGPGEVFSPQNPAHPAQETSVLQLFHDSQVSIEVKGCQRESGSLFGYGKNERTSRLSSDKVVRLTLIFPMWNSATARPHFSF